MREAGDPGEAVKPEDEELYLLVDFNPRTSYGDKYRLIRGRGRATALFFERASGVMVQVGVDTRPRFMNIYRDTEVHIGLMRVVAE